nr:hypothetical protein L204_02540 [Cryptococcus depauperatus CBS 7855]
MTSLFRLPPPSITLAFGGLTTSFVFFTAVSDETRGIIPLLNGRLGPAAFDDKTRAGIWGAYLKKAGARFKNIIGGSVLSALLHFTVSYSHPSPFIRRLTFASGVTSLLILPITFLSGVLKINARLQAIEDDTQTPEKDEVKSLVETWEIKHLFRMPAYGMAWALSFVAICFDKRGC